MNELQLAPFADFAEAFNVSRYKPVPDGWSVAVSDVVGSTEAISRGRYKDVNMAGAATIACVLNACGRDDLPFAFGGDGGVVLVPPEFDEQCKNALRATQRMCTAVLGLNLRVSFIPIAEVRKRGRDLLVASHDLGSGKLLAMLAGGGIETADQLCKSPDGAEFTLSRGGGEPDLSGLSCRWDPLKPQHGIVLSLVIRSRDEASVMPSIYHDIYRRISAETDSDNSPVRSSAFSVRWSPEGMNREAAIQGQAGRFKRKLRIMLENTVSIVSLISGKKLGGFDATAYVDSLSRHSDYRKYADSLRMVIDCTQAQADAIKAMLDAECKKGTIHYGTHCAKTALMTCFVRNTDEKGHIHFIDGADGGYALAALDMKQRVASN